MNEATLLQAIVLGVGALWLLRKAWRWLRAEIPHDFHHPSEFWPTGYDNGDDEE